MFAMDSGTLFYGHIWYGKVGRIHEFLEEC